MPQDREIKYDRASDYYRILSVTPTASLDDIKRAYRELAKKVHPDRNPTRKARAHQQFTQINAAYGVLSNTELRAEYDRQRTFYLHQIFGEPTPTWRANFSATTSAQRPPYHEAKKSKLFKLFTAGIYIF